MIAPSDSISNDTPRQSRPSGRMSARISGREITQDISSIISDVASQAQSPDRRDYLDLFVVPEANKLRKLWDVILAACLLYVATYFPYKLSFVQFRLDSVVTTSDEASNSKRYGYLTWGDGVEVLESIVELIFLADLILNFLFSYRDRHDREVLSFKRIVCKYAKFYFWFNVLACFPQELIALMVVASDDRASDGVNKVTRFTRISRASRLVRLFRVVRIRSALAFITKRIVITSIQRRRKIRIFNFLVCFAWFVHLAACGWYLVAACHDDPLDTWVGRRIVDHQGTLLLQRPPFEQWVHSMYFILATYSSCGFGDIAAYTFGECMYAIVIIVVGAVVNSILISEVIGALLSIDDKELEKRKRRALLQSFARHVDLDGGFLEKLQDWSDSDTSVECYFNKDDMWKLLTSSALPHRLWKNLPRYMHQGRLARNRFVTEVIDSRTHSERFISLLSLNVTQHGFCAKDFAYQMGEHAFSVFLVLSGTFAYVAIASSKGGEDAFVESFEEVTAVKEAPKETFHTSITGASLGNILPHMFRMAFDTSEHEPGTVEVHPYQTFSCGAYFGDIEVFFTSPRRSTARCERDGLTLVLPKRDLTRLLDEFPPYLQTWKWAAMKREIRRKRQLKQHCLPLNYKVRAVRIIQVWLRGIFARRTRRKSTVTSTREAPWTLELSDSSRETQPEEQEPSNCSLEALSAQLQAAIKQMEAVGETMKRLEAATHQGVVRTCEI